MNKMAEVAKLFDKKLEERFTIIDDNGVVVDACFDEAGVAFFNPNNDKTLTSQGILNKLLTGTYRIKKLPWKPKPYEIYYIPDPTMYEKYRKAKYIGNTEDEVAYDRRFICKTPEQAIEIAKAMIKLVREMRRADDE